MPSSLHHGVNWILIGLTVSAMLAAAVYFVASLWGWRGPYRKRRLVKFAICLLAIPILAGLQRLYFFHVYYPTRQAEAAARRAARAESGSLVHIGDLAPQIQLLDTCGREFSLENSRGKVVLVNFFATWCEPCRVELPHLEKLYLRHRGDPRFAMLVIGREETTDVVKSFQKQFDYPFPMAADPDGSTVAKYAQESIPRTYLISSDGRIAFAVTGFSLEELGKLEGELVRQLARTSVPNSD